MTQTLLNSDSKIHILPGCQPQTAINSEAAIELQKVVNRLHSGESVGVAWAEIDSRGKSYRGWNTPSGMGADIYTAVSGLQFEMISSKIYPK